jgi:hypothetical protein
VKLLIREGHPEATAEAHRILDGIYERIGPLARIQYFEGETHSALLASLAVAYSNIGDEHKAITITRQSLENLGIPSDLRLAAGYVEATPALRRHVTRIAIELSNLTARRFKLAYLQAFVGNRGDARDQLEQAHIEGEQSLLLMAKTDTPGAQSGRLVSRANLCRVELEQAALFDDPADREAALIAAESKIAEVMLASYEAPFISPGTRLIRAGQLGMAQVERASIRESSGDFAAAKSLGWTARLALKASSERFRHDADEPLGITFRYGLACALTGSPKQAARIWLRSRERLTSMRGDRASTAAERLVELIARLDAAAADG